MATNVKSRFSVDQDLSSALSLTGPVIITGIYVWSSNPTAQEVVMTIDGSAVNATVKDDTPVQINPSGEGLFVGSSLTISATATEEAMVTWYHYG